MWNWPLTGVRLSSSDTDGVVTLRNDRIAFLCDHVEIARVEMEVHLLGRAPVEMNALKPAESNERSSLYRREIEIKLEPLYPFGYGLWASADCCMGPAKSIPVHATTRTRMTSRDSSFVPPGWIEPDQLLTMFLKA
jgi:hypothetical protein